MVYPLCRYPVIKQLGGSDRMVAGQCSNLSTYTVENLPVCDEHLIEMANKLKNQEQ